MAETLPNGVVVPNADGSETISATGVAEVRALGSSVDTALANQRWPHDRLTQPTDIFTLPLGVYALTGSSYAAMMTNLPPGELKAGTITVTKVSGYGWREIIYAPTGVDYYWRTVSSATNENTMQSWTRWDRPRNTMQGNLPDGTAWDQLYTMGMWRVSGSATLADRGHTGFPPDATTNGFLTVTNGIEPGVSPWAAQTYQQFGTSPAVWWRITRSAVYGQWNDWVLLTPDDYARTTGQTSQILKEQFTLRRGGPIGIGAKGAVAFRFDHGLVNFANIVLPLMEKYNIPCSQAYFTDMFGASAYGDESAGFSWADARTWAATRGVEPTSHSHTHGMVYGRAAITQQIKGSAQILATQIPGSIVETYTVPGGGSDYFPGGSNASDYYDSMAGRMLADTYAVTTGYLGGNIRPLDGTIRQGLRHITIDESASATAAKTAITRASKVRGGVVVMMHPSRIGYGTGYTSAADLESVIAHVAALRDAGLIEVMTLGGLALAKTGATERLNLLLDGTFPADWAASFTGTTGWTRATDASGAFITSTTGGQISQLIAPGWVRPHRGIVMQVAAQVRSPDGGKARIGSSTLGVSRDVAVGTTWQDIRAFVTMPADADTSFEVNVGRVSGTIQIANLRFEPV